MVFSEHVKVREEKFGAVIFETLKEKVFVTNEAGKDILGLIEKGDSVAEILTKIKDVYETEISQIQDDVKDFIAQLKEKGIISQ